MTWRTIGGRRLWTCEQHHYALEAWAQTRDEAGHALALISFDYHTDTLPAFNARAVAALKKRLGRPPTRAERDEECHRQLTAVDWTDPSALVQEMYRLSHDEHLAAAVHAGVVRPVFIILGSATPAHEASFATVLPASGPDERTLVDSLLEDRTLAPKVAEIERAIGPLALADYILDIDLDFFRSLRAIRPAQPATFHRLIRHARAITVAQEPGCVGLLRLEGEWMVSAQLERELVGHVERA